MNEKELTLEEKWEQATIANNFLFYKVMHDNPDVCKQLLEILLEMEIDKIDMNTQEVINIDWRSKGIRLDVYAKNSNQVFDIEMQSTDTLELPERARYYQGAMDIDSLKAGDEYKDLKNSYVILSVFLIFSIKVCQYTLSRTFAGRTRPFRLATER